MTGSDSYILITPTKDEEALIGVTIECVVRQTVRPLEWIIVNDGSTDKTHEIIKAATVDYPWIRQLDLPRRRERNFAAVVLATETGLRALSVSDYHFLGLLDSDLRFGPSYFEQVLAEFAKNPRLGLAGGVVVDVDAAPSHLPLNRSDVPGAVQFFRRDCFERLGGLLPIPEGGWDAITCAQARMHGYETKLLTSIVVDHLKPRNFGEGSVFRRKYQMGFRDHALGNHPIFELVKCLVRLGERPWVVGALVWLLGFVVASLRQRPQRITPDLLSFIRREQISRLRSAFTVGFRRGGRR